MCIPHSLSFLVPVFVAVIELLDTNVWSRTRPTAGTRIDHRPGLSKSALIITRTNNFIFFLGAALISDREYRIREVNDLSGQISF